MLCVRCVEVLDWRRVTRNYLKTWFLLDFFSSLPLEDIVAAFASDAANVATADLFAHRGARKEL